MCCATRDTARLCVVMALLANSTASGGPGLLLDPWRDPTVVERLSNQPGLLDGFSRVHLLTFSNGQTLYPTHVPPFSQAPSSVGEDLLAQCRATCMNSEVECYWAMDLLLWERADVESPRLFGKCPDWFELGESGGCGTGVDPAKYASPFHQGVRSALRELVVEIATQQPAPDGFALCCRLSPYELLGYSVASREAFIAARSLDPIDLHEQGYKAAWGLWRQDYLSDFVREILGQLRAARPQVPVAAWGTGNYYAKSTSLKGRTADNWLAWMRDGIVSEALLDTTWHERWNRSVWDILRRMAEEARKEKGSNAQPGFADFLDRLHPLVRTRTPEGAPCLKEELEALEQQGARLENVVFWPVVAEDWEAVGEAARRLSGQSPEEGEAPDAEVAPVKKD